MGEKMRSQTEEKYNLIAKRFKELGISRRAEAAQVIGAEMGVDPTLIMRALIWKYGKVLLTNQNKSRNKKIVRIFNSYSSGKKSDVIKFLAKKYELTERAIYNVVLKGIGRRKFQHFIKHKTPHKLIKLHCGIYVKDNIMGNYMRGRL